MEELVIPQLQAYKKELSEKFKKTTHPYTKKNGEDRVCRVTETIAMDFSHRLTDSNLQLKEYRIALIKKHSCSPWPTLLLPQLTYLPIFMVSTFVFQSACVAPSPLESESVFTLVSLANPDPTGTLPIIIGLLTLANVETSQWLIGGKYARDALQLAETTAKQDAEKGVVKIRPQAISKNILRAFSICRMIIGMLMPGVSGRSQSS